MQQFISQGGQPIRYREAVAAQLAAVRPYGYRDMRPERSGDHVTPASTSRHLRAGSVRYVISSDASVVTIARAFRPAISAPVSACRNAACLIARSALPQCRAVSVRNACDASVSGSFPAPALDNV